jgi:nicotinamide-nucleotide amidase
MEQHIKTRMAVRLLVKDPFQQGQTYVSISLAVVLLIFLGPPFLLSQSAGCLSAESNRAQAADSQQIISFTSFNEWHQRSQIEAAVTKKLSQNTICHSERSEESLISVSQTLRFAQGDSFEIVSKQNQDFKYRGRFVNPRPAQPTRYMIVVTGGELLSGVYADGHTYFITRTLRPLGLQCVGSMSVDDKQADIKEALRYATDKAALVIVTGGLGPTENDITRETLSDFTGIALKEHPEVLQNMARRFRVSPAKVRSNLRRQTQVPTQGTYFKNPNGTAVGLVFEMANATIVALPGPPRELQAMVSDELVPYLSRRFGTRLPGCSLTLRFVGLGQSQIDQTLRDHVPLESDITVSSQFEASRVDFTFSLPDDTRRDRARLQELKRKITEHLGEYIYAEDEISLEEHLLKLLEARDETLVLVEVSSGGSLAAALSNADGAHRVLAGAYIAPTIKQLRRLLGVQNDNWTESTSRVQRTERLATAAADATGSQWAVAVGEAWRDESRPSKTGRDESGTGYVDIVFKLPSGRLESRKVRFRGTGELAGSRLSTQLLDQLRRRLK